MENEWQSIIPPRLWRLDKVTDVVDILIVAQASGETQSEPSVLLADWLKFLGGVMTVEFIQLIKRRQSNADPTNPPSSAGPMQEGTSAPEP